MEYYYEAYQRNLCGIGIIYPVYGYSGSGNNHEPFPSGGNSRINRHKRTIANRVEYMRLNAVNKCLVFTLTCPIACDYREQNTNLSLFFNNMSKPHKWGRFENYVWVREYQQNGRPHWHCIADTPFVSAVETGLYWGNLWTNTTLSNSFSMNTGANRFLSANPDRLCWYLTKYFVKNFDKKGKQKEAGRVRMFGSSEALTEGGKPTTHMATNCEAEIAQKDVIELGHGTFYCIPKT